MILSQNSPMIFFKKANKLKQEGLLEEAVVAYQSAIAENPNFYWSYHNLGETLVKLDRPYEAVTYYQRALELNPNSTVSHQNLGDVYRVLDHRDVAVFEYLQALKYSPNNYRLYNKLGQSLYQMLAFLKPEYLLEHFHLCEQIKEILPDISYSYGSPYEIYYLKDEYFLKETDLLSNDCFLEEAYRTYLKRKPDEHGKEHYLYHLQHGLSRQEIISAFRQSPEFNSLLVFLIKSIYLQVAIAVCRHSIGLNPNYKQSYDTLIELGLLWGNVLTQQGKLDEAIDIYNEVLAVDRNNLRLNNLKLGEAHYQLGYALSQNKKVDEGIESYRQAITLRPDWADPHLMLAGLLLYDDQFDEAIEMYERAIALRPDWAEAYLIVGNAMLYQDKLEKAIERYEQAIALSPDWAEPHLTLGNALFRENKLEQAIESYEQAIALEPQRAYAHYCLGNVLLKQGKYEQALSCHRTALTLNPNWNADHYFSLGFNIYYQENLEGIKQIYNQALALKTDWFDGYISAGNWLKNLLGNQSGAITFWRIRLHLLQKLDHQIIYYYGFDWTRNIGHIAFFDIVVKLTLLNLWESQKHGKFIWTPPQQLVANKCLLNYWTKYIPVISDSSLPALTYSAKYQEEFSGLVTLSDGQMITLHSTASLVQKQWEAEGHPPLLTLSGFDSERGWHCLQQLGVPKDAWFVCLHVREPGFYKQWNNCSARDCDINTYLLAIESIVARGGWVIRLGDPSMNPLPSMDRVIDYPHTEYKSDWMDVFLCAKCRFLLGTNSGLCAVPTNFGVPVILTNLPHLGYLPWFGIWIPKRYWSEAENRELNFAERVREPFGYIDPIKILSSMGIKVIDNTPEEINDLVIEMLELLDNTLNYTEEDKELQQQFRRIVKQYAGYDCNSQLGRKFLKKNAYLLSENQPNLGVPTSQKKVLGQSEFVKVPGLHRKIIT